MVATVFSVAAIGGILSATTMAVSRVQLSNARSVAAGVIQHQMDCARASARGGILVAGARIMTLNPSGTSSVVGQTLATDQVPSVNVSQIGAPLRVVRTTTLETGTTDIVKVAITATWNPSGTTADGRNTITLTTYMRVPCD